MGQAEPKRLKSSMPPQRCLCQQPFLAAVATEPSDAESQLRGPGLVPTVESKFQPWGSGQLGQPPPAGPSPACRLGSYPVTAHMESLMQCSRIHAPKGIPLERTLHRDSSAAAATAGVIAGRSESRVPCTKPRARNAYPVGSRPTPSSRGTTLPCRAWSTCVRIQIGWGRRASGGECARATVVRTMHLSCR